MRATDSLYHLVSRDDWSRHFDGESYAPPTLETEGFVHLSTLEQLPVSRGRWFAEVAEPLVIEILAGRLHRLIWEDLHGHGAYPHHYGPIPAEAVREIRIWNDADAR